MNSSSCKKDIFEIFNRERRSTPFIIADLGLTCGGSLSRAISLIDIASILGVDAVKFQMIDSAELLGDTSVTYTYPLLSGVTKTENMFSMFKKLEFTDHEWHELATRCQNKNVEMIVTCHVESAVARIEKLNLKVNKICTWSLNHYRMIASLAKNNKPLILDTGTINMEELLSLKKFYHSNGGSDLFVLFDFHTSNEEEMNFSSIKSLIAAGFPVGYTPQGRKDWLDYMSVGLGVSFLEKRLTLSRNFDENGHWKALTPDEFFLWMSQLNQCSNSLGDGIFKGTKQDKLDSQKYYKSAWLSKSVSKGDLIVENDFVYKRPGTGISSQDMMSFIGQSYHRDFIPGEMFKP